MRLASSLMSSFSAKENNVSIIVSEIEALNSDYYLWLTGQGVNWFHGEGNYGFDKPER